MATPERDTIYTNDANRTVYTRESNGTGWFVGIIVALALLAIGYLVFSANSGPATSVDVNGVPAVEAPLATDPAPMTQAPAAAPEAAPMAPAAAPEVTAPVEAPAATETTTVPAVPAT